MRAAHTPYGPGDSISWGRCSGDPMDPRTPEPDVEEISEDDAPDLAADLIRSTPAVWSQWLDAECNDDRDTLCPVTLTRILRSELRGLCVPELLVLLMTCPEKDMQQVRWQLVERFDAAHKAQAAEDAADMLREQRRQQRLAAQDWPELWS